MIWGLGKGGRGGGRGSGSGMSFCLGSWGCEGEVSEFCFVLSFFKGFCWKMIWKHMHGNVWNGDACMHVCGEDCPLFSSEYMIMYSLRCSVFLS